MRMTPTPSCQQNPPCKTRRTSFWWGPMFDSGTSTWPGSSCSTTSGLACRASYVECSISRTRWSFGSTMRSSLQPSMPDQGKRTNAPARFTQLKWARRTPTILRLTLSNYNRQSSGRYQAQPAHKNNQQRPQNKSWRQNSQGNNSNRNSQTCIFCKMQNHRQEECRKRIKANKPCLDSNRCPFWPKVNDADSNPTNSVEALTFTFQDFQWWAWWNPYIKLPSSFLS